MLTKAAGVTVLVALLSPAAEKAPPAGKVSNSVIEVVATLYNGKDAVREVLGSEVKAEIVVVEVEVIPKSRRAMMVDPDDFFLRSDKDGERSQPFAPSQIAGPGALKVSARAVGGGNVMGDSNGPAWGGVGGPPGRLPGSGGGVGNATSDAHEMAVGEASKGPEDPLLAKLKAKALPMKETDVPLKGLLYFPLEGKHKTKDLELEYRGPAGKMSMRFRNLSK
jgi:hypothetical protein